MAWKRAFKQAFAYLYIAFEANALLVGAYIIAAIGVIELLAPVSHLFEFPLTVRLGIGGFLFATALISARHHHHLKHLLHKYMEATGVLAFLIREVAIAPPQYESLEMLSEVLEFVTQMMRDVGHASQTVNSAIYIRRGGQQSFRLLCQDYTRLFDPDVFLNEDSPAAHASKLGANELLLMPSLSEHVAVDVKQVKDHRGAGRQLMLRPVTPYPNLAAGKELHIIGTCWVKISFNAYQDVDAVLAMGSTSRLSFKAAQMQIVSMAASLLAIPFARFLGEDAYPIAMRPAPPSPPTIPAKILKKSHKRGDRRRHRRGK